jgi:hypothetical protein
VFAYGAGPNAMPTFACTNCGCVSIRVPPDIDADVLIACRDCGHPHGTWAELKRRAEAARNSAHAVDMSASAARIGYASVEP